MSLNFLASRSCADTSRTVAFRLNQLHCIRFSFLLLLATLRPITIFFFFFFNDPAPTEIYPLPLPDALPICPRQPRRRHPCRPVQPRGDALLPPGRPAAVRRGNAQPEADVAPAQDAHAAGGTAAGGAAWAGRSEEHTSELQSQSNLVCRLLLE